jgi:hypothetical protein
MSAGKGDKPRPINKEQFDSNFDKINWNQKENKSVEIKNKKGKITYKY